MNELEERKELEETIRWTVGLTLGIVFGFLIGWAARIPLEKYPQVEKPTDA